MVLSQLAILPLLFCVQTPTPASSPDDTTPLVEYLSALGGQLNLVDLLNEARGSETMTDQVRDKNPQTGLARFLKDVDFEFRTFESGDGRATLGMHYDFAKAIMRPEEELSDDFQFSVRFSGEGNVAFDKDVNPNDFLETGFELSYSRHTIDGQIAFTEAEQKANQAILQTIASQDADPAEYEKTEDWRTFKKAIGRALGRETLTSFTASAKYESNQDFSETQLAYGADASFTIRENRDDHWLSRWNVFDYPFALLRLLLDTRDHYLGETFSRGTALPSFQLGLDLVDPTDNSMREALGEDDPFPRFRSRIEVNSLVGRDGDTELRGRMGWRFFSELGAPQAIEDADLDRFSYLYVALDLPRGWFVSYATGELPLDVQGDDVFEVGFRYTTPK